jgi:hypothetical protein
MSITMINVGLPHPLWRPQAKCGAAFNDDTGLLVIGLPKPTCEEIAAFQEPGRFGLMKHRDIFIYTLLFGTTFCLSTPYHASHISRDETPSLAGVGEHKLLMMCLVDALTGETISIRTSTLSPHLTAMLQRHVCQQVANPISPNDALGDFQNWNSTYPTQRSVIRASTWCQLGDAD